MKGQYIVFSGLDNSGKSTQVKLLEENLEKKGIEVIITREPGSPYLPFNVRDLLLDSNKEIDPVARELLFQADRAAHTAFIKKHLERNIWVISDRGFLDGMAYGMAHGHTSRFFNWFLRNTIKVLPDLTIYMDMNLKTFSKRQSERSIKTFEENKGLEHLKKVKKNFNRLLSTFSHLKVKSENSIEQNQKDILEFVENNCIIKETDL